MVFICLFVNAQTDKFPQPSLDSLTERFSDDYAAVVNASETIEFKVDKSDSQLSIIHKITEEIVALKQYSSFTVYRYYDQFSEIIRKKVSKSSNKIQHSIECGGYEQEGIFYHDSKVCAFAFYTDNIGDAATVESTTMIYDARHFARVYFADLYPTHKKDFVFKIPDGVSVEILEFNFENFNITKDEHVNQVTGERTVHYTLKDVPAYRIDNIPDINYVFPYIIAIPQTFESNGKTHHIFSSDSTLYEWYYNLIEKEVKGIDQLDELANSLVDEHDTDFIKMQKVLRWVQQNIRYIAFEYGIDGYKPEEAIAVLENKYGDCKGMTSLLVVLLNQLNIDARYCWISTNSQPYKERFSSPAVDDHMICAVSTDTGFIFLDATNKYQLLGEVDERLQGNIALIDDGKNKYIIRQLPKTPPSSNSIRSLRNLTLKNDTLYEEINVSYSGLLKHTFQYFINEVTGSESDEALEKLLAGYETNLEIYDIQYDANQLVDKQLLFNYSVKQWNKVLYMDDLLFIPFDNETSQYSAIDTSRIYPYLVGDRSLRTVHLIFHLPALYTVDYLPENTDYTSSDFSYAFTYEQQGDSIIYTKVLEISNGFLKPEGFSEWNEFLTKYNKQCEELVILRKQAGE